MLSPIVAGFFGNVAGILGKYSGEFSWFESYVSYVTLFNTQEISKLKSVLNVFWILKFMLNRKI